MSRYALSTRSLERLAGVHSDLVRVVVRALQLSPVDFTVTEGLRTYERQKHLYQSGASQTLHSRHLTGHAVDIAPIVNGEVPWEDWSVWLTVSEAFKQAAAELGVDIVWGGDWASLRDGPHYELKR